MKIAPKRFFIFICALLLAFSCSDDDVNEEESAIDGSGNITVTMSVNIANTPFETIMVEYRDAGRIKRTESLTAASWSKSIKVSRGFDIFFNVSGSGDGGGKIDIKVIASENEDRLFSFERTEDSEVSFAVDVTVEKEL